MNPRYIAYAAAHGRAPESMMAHDDAAWPGGRMCGFTLWIADRWRDWKQAQPESRRNAARHGWILSDDDHASFDAMLRLYNNDTLAGGAR